jgi:NadR type nicotinamide-nucleotide adenylyltransferase
MKRVVITGPESTGKSWLAKNLAKHYDTVWVPEYARDYIASLKREYTQNDILYIAQQQLKLEQEQAQKANGLLFCDTSMLVTKIWSDFVFGSCPDWIEQQLDNHIYDLYLLCYIDTPWEEDPLREHPNKRKTLFSIYENELKQRDFPFEIITGLDTQRLNNAVHAIEKHFPDV